MKKTMKQHSFASRLKSLALAFGIALSFASCANDDLAQSGTMSTDAKDLTAFSTGNPTTRTSMKEDGTFYWEAGDKIYVKDDGGTWHASSNSPTGKTASFKFLVPGTYIAHSSYEVYYPGRNGANDQVTIPANQIQFAPNTTTNFGASGDCGMALASRIGANNQFSFVLDHKVAYLRFLPRTANFVLEDCYLTKIEITSNNNITGTYTLDPTADAGAGALTGTGSGKQIVLTNYYGIHGGFPLTNSITDATKNGSYVIIKPGTHTLTVRYWLRDAVSGTEGTITKMIYSQKFDQNKYYDITANLDVKNYDGDHYYMWDAQDQYWAGYEWTKKLPTGTGQPIIDGDFSTNYARNHSDSRYCSEYYPGWAVSNPATHASFNNVPNANEMSWYAMKGEPHWDNDELWTAMGHLYKGGMWFLKKAFIFDYTPNKAANKYYGYLELAGSCSNSSVSSGHPFSPGGNKYFFLSAMGFYSSGTMHRIGYEGYYWASSGFPQNKYKAYRLFFDKNHVEVDIESRDYGFRAQAFE